MARLILFVLVLFFLLTVLRGFRIFFRAVFPKAEAPPARPQPPRLEGEMIRDPVCGTWLDRRLALPVRRGAETVSVCSEDCRRKLEAAG
jgi:hypothetical protein